ncbi:hypothetical protein Hamer_G005882 [Homarus americanus]|uniref:Uncharacterized protein n=1 Tax=Homarus americanus TaxID=6706 RepID=A0A8J5MN75_HOMAM|nr:hypothetical protein Hamer_G005882 [Homarus americanus]
MIRPLNLDRDVFDKKTWLLRAAGTVNRLRLKNTILSKGPDTMSQNYSTPAPVIVKAPIWIRIENLHMETGLTSLRSRSKWLTDGSVEPSNTRAGAAFTIEGDDTVLWRTSDGMLHFTS